MKTIIVILRYEDGREVALIGPDQEIPPGDDLVTVTFSGPREMPGVVIPDIIDVIGTERITWN